VVATKALLGSVCCGLVLLMVGCGGGNSRLAPRAYAREASALCARSNRAVARITVPAIPIAGDGSHAAARALTHIVAVERDTIEALRDLRPPERLTDTVQRWIALLDQGADELELMAARLRSGHGTQALDFGAKAVTLLDRAREVAAPLRVTSCRGPMLPAV
jgi:hypothetical protein